MRESCYHSALQTRFQLIDIISAISENHDLKKNSCRNTNLSFFPLVFFPLFVNRFLFFSVFFSGHPRHGPSDGTDHQGARSDRSDPSRSPAAAAGVGVGVDVVGVVSAVVL